MQKESSVGKRFDTFGIMSQLPDEVMLHEHPSFLSGLAHCILNGYYGTMDRGTLNERRTVLEFDATALDMGHPVHNKLAFVRPDQVGRIMERVLATFPYQHYDYLDCIRLKRKITEVFIFFNLLIYGRLSILYRDNMQTWYCDEFDHPDLVKNIREDPLPPEEIMTAESLHASLAVFFQNRGILPKEVGLTVWVNPNSAATQHSLLQIVQKENDLASLMERYILLEHGNPREAPKGEQNPTSPHQASETPKAPAAKHPTYTWKQRYERLMKQMGIDTRSASLTGQKKHPKFRPKIAGKNPTVQAEGVQGELVHISVDTIVFSCNQPLSLGKEQFIEIHDKVLVRTRITGCNKHEEGITEGSTLYRIQARISNPEQGYRCFVMLASESAKSKT